MDRSPPTPICRCFVLCRQVYVEPVRQDHALISVIHQIVSPIFPIVEPLSVFARWTNAHGAYRIEVQLRTLEGNVCTKVQWEKPFESRNPLETWIVPLRSLNLQFPRPGKYEIAMLANGQDVATDIITALLPGEPYDQAGD